MKCEYCGKELLKNNKTKYCNKICQKKDEYDRSHLEYIEQNTPIINDELKSLDKIIKRGGRNE